MVLHDTVLYSTTQSGTDILSYILQKYIRLYYTKLKKELVYRVYDTKAKCVMA